MTVLQKIKHTKNSSIQIQRGREIRTHYKEKQNINDLDATMDRKRRRGRKKFMIGNVRERKKLENKEQAQGSIHSK